MAFEWPVRIYWEDTDAGGIVFYANYLKFFERARTEWLRSLDLGQHNLRELTGGMFVVTDASLQGCGRASMTINQQALLKPQQISPGSAPTVLCEGSIRIGWVDGASMRPARIPDSVLQAISQS